MGGVESAPSASASGDEASAATIVEVGAAAAPAAGGFERITSVQ